MKRIAIVGNFVSVMLNFRGDLIVDLVSQGHHVCCYCIDYTEESREKVLSLGAYPVDYSLDSKGMNPLRDIPDLLRLYRDFKLKKFDVVFPYFVKPALFVGAVAKIAGVPRVVGMVEGLGNAFVDYLPSTLKRSFVKFSQIVLYKLLVRYLDLIIFLNPDDKRDILDRYAVRHKDFFILGGIGVDLRHFNPEAYSDRASSDVTFVFVARLLREKGIFEYLEAARIVKLRYFGVKFLVLGGFDDGNPFALQRGDLDAYIADGTVVYPGFVTNINEYVGRSSIFVLPSFYREGVPRSTQEAMALGKPVITTDVPGCRETVVDRVNGLLVPPLDVNALSNAMIYFLENPGEIDRMGLESRRMAIEKYDVKKVNERLMSVILG